MSSPSRTAPLLGPPLRSLLCSLLCSLAGGLLSGCAVLPDWSHRESLEVSVLVDYEMAAGEGFVVLPASNDWLTVLHLHTRPGTVRESFMGDERRMHVPPQTTHVRVLCHYKLYRQRDKVGRMLAWPTAAELFPGAARIRHTTAMTDSDFLEE